MSKMRNTQELKNIINSGTKKLSFLFFYGHHPSKNGKLTSTCFSQWWKCSFEVDNIKYANTEQYMMAEKARLFNDKETLMKILKESNPYNVKKLGRIVKRFDDNLWKEKRFDIVVKGNFAKFSQNQDLKEFLLNTKETVIVEASPYDRIWGIGLGKDHKDVANPYKWLGHNLLGFALMEVRDQLKIE